MEKLLIIADAGDGDLVSSVHPLTEAEVTRVKKIVSVVCGHEVRHNWDMRHRVSSVPPYFAYEQELPEGDIEWFMQLTPRCEHGIHTIIGVMLIHSYTQLL